MSSVQAEERSAATARLSVDAASACASFQELAAGVARRSNRIRLVSDKAVIPALVAALKRGADGAIAAELVVTHKNGKRSVRRLSAPTCSEAVDALALVIVITLDPASLSEQSGDSGTASGSSGDKAAPDLAAGASEQASRAAGDGEKSKESTAGAAGVEKRPPGSAGNVSAESAGEQPLNRPRETAFHWRAGAAFDATLGPAPKLMPGVALTLGASWDRAGLWSPALRLAATHYWLSGIGEADGDADFELDTGSLDACPVRLGRDALALRACMNLQAGRLFARGSNTFAPESHSRPFAVLGGSLLLETLLLARIDASFGFSFGKTLVMDDFAFAPTVFHHVSAFTLGAALGAALRFQ